MTDGPHDPHPRGDDRTSYGDQAAVRDKDDEIVTGVYKARAQLVQRLITLEHSEPDPDRRARIAHNRVALQHLLTAILDEFTRTDAEQYRGPR